MGMVVSVASGKGGTGKTTIATSLALSLGRGVQLIDCDVEEPNAHIFLKPKIDKTETISIPVPEVDRSKCDFCGKCAEVCAYNALAVLKNDVLVFANLCHGCGGCSLICPRKAISEVDRNIGVIESGNTKTISFVHGKLNIGEAMSPPLIRAVKKLIDPRSIAIIDVPAGTSCSVIEAIKKSHLCILVTEPTPFGLNDLTLAVEVVKKLKIPMGVVINRADSGYEKVDNYCKKESIPVLMRIPFDRRIAVSYSKGIPLIHEQKEYTKQFIDMFDAIKKLSLPYGKK
jgi:MinD superfamily P-loop ATPase